jgi:type IV pilus assembly protein PilV
MPSVLTAVKQPRGFTLVEALVALLVISIGMLGLAGLQVRALRFNQESFARSQGGMLAQDLFEQLRLNTNLTGYRTDCANVGACNAAPAAASVTNDVACWCNRLASALPTSTASVGVAGTSPATVTIQISWLNRADATSQNPNPTPTTATWTALIDPKSASVLNVQ